MFTSGEPHIAKKTQLSTWHANTEKSQCCFLYSGQLWERVLCECVIYIPTICITIHVDLLVKTAVSSASKVKCNDCLLRETVVTSGPPM
jgi:hypothetical protein